MKIYLDYAAATPVDERVLAAMLPYFTDQFYNPSSPYLAGRAVRAAVEDARARVAHWLGAKPAEIIFTAGATEAINIALHGVMQRFGHAKVITCAVDHVATQAVASCYNHEVVGVWSTGAVQLEKLRQAIGEQAVLVSVDYANSEIGTIQPVEEIAALIAEVRAQRQKSGNALPLYLHTDASQAAGHLDLHVAQLGVDLLTINGGKIYGPKQTGALFVRGGLQLVPYIEGGGQESGLRSGTENVPGIVGLAAALDLVQQNRKESNIKLAALRDELQRRLVAACPDMLVNGNLKKRLPNVLHVSWPGLDGERLLMQLDEQGIQVATGAACAANKQQPSQVLKAIGLDESARQGSLRLSLGASTTSDEIVRAAEFIVAATKKRAP
ncbi:MAG TPA: cysteine desulfurase family protein [Candidatus Acidoferrum sp.]|nr:cysteine desulfurase family protein [Candidatus Acidoferrum sp.]